MPVVGAEDQTQQAEDFYESELLPILEPRLNGCYAAIHPSTCAYAVERGPGKALRAVRTQRPSGQIVVRHIGPANSGLKARLRGEQPS